MPTHVSCAVRAHCIRDHWMQWGPPPTNTSPPLITAAVAGIAAVYVPGVWDNAGAVSIQWNLNGIPIPGATGSIYIGSVGDIGKTLTVTETAVNTPSGFTLSVTSAGITISLV